MSAPDKFLPEILQQLLPHLAAEHQRKVTAVRWFNRLFFEVEKWNQDFIGLLRTYQKREGRDANVTLRQFDKKLESFVQALEGRWTAEKWDLCCNLRMLSARFARDFAWLEKEDSECYWNLRRLIDEAYGNENTIIDHAKRVAFEIRYQTRTNNCQEVNDQIEKYVEESRAAVDQLQRIAEQSGVNLLTVEQYEIALKNDGSFDARLLVLGDLTMGHKVKTGNNAIINIDSKLSHVVQKITSAKSVKDPQKKLAKLLDNFSSELDKIRKDYGDEVVLMESRLAELSKQLDKPKKEVNKGLLNLTRNGLVEAAQTVASIAPAVLETSKQIAEYIGGFFK